MKNTYVSMADVAKKAKVSTMTVSLALGALESRKRISEDTRARIVKVAKEMGYRKNATISEAMQIIAKKRWDVTSKPTRKLR